MAPKQYLDDDGEPVGKGSGITPPAGYSLLMSKKSDKPKKTASVKELKLEAAKRTPVVTPKGYLLTKSPLLDQFYAKEKQRVADAPVSEGADAFNAPAARVAPLYKPTYNPANQAAGAQSTLASVPNAPKPKTIGEEVKAQRAGSHITYVAPNIGQPSAHPDLNAQAVPMHTKSLLDMLLPGVQSDTAEAYVLSGVKAEGEKQREQSARWAKNLPRLLPQDKPLTTEEKNQVATLSSAASKGNFDPTKLSTQQKELLQRNWVQTQPGIAGAVQRATRDKLSDLSRVDQLAVMALIPESKFVSLFFGGQMAQGVIHDAPEAWKAYQAGDHEKAAALATSAIIDGAMAGMAAKHLAGGKNPSLTEIAGQGLTEGAGDVMGGRTITDHPFTPVVVAPSRDRTNVLHRNTAGEVRQAKGQAPTVWLSPTAWKSLMGAMYPKESAESIAATHGINLEANEKLLALANNPELAATNPVFGEVQRLLAEAHKNAGKGGVAIGERRTEYIPDLNRIDPNTGEVVKDPKTGKPYNRVMQANINVMREELNHTWQRSLAANGKWQNHLSEKSFSSLLSALPKGMVSHLVENNYDGSDAPLMVTESAARLMGGDPGYFSVTPEEAASFMHSYFDEVVKQHGPEALNSLKRIRGVAKQVKETVDAEHKARGTNDGMGNGAADRGNLQGVPTGGRRAPESIQATQQSGEGKEGGIDGIHNSSQNVETTGSPISDEGSQALRNVHDNTGMVGETLFNREKDKPIWYLKSERLIGEKMRGPMPAGDVQKMLLAGGVKPDEMKWTGLDDFLDSKGKEKVTPDEIREHLANNNIQIKEVTKGEPELKVEPSEDALGEFDVVDKTGSVRFSGSTQEEAQDYVNDETEDNTKYGSYVLPGGENYREMLLTMPPKPFDPVLDKEFADISKEHNDITNSLRSGSFTPEQQKRLADINQRQDEILRLILRLQDKHEQSGFKSRHWDEPNVLAHVRFNDRTGPNGEKLLHLEELQSDWAQKIRKRGFKDPQREAELKQQIDTIKNEYNIGGTPADIRKWRAEGVSEDEIDRRMNDKELPFARYEEMRNKLRPLESELDKLQNALPDMPFKKTWHEMALRRALKYATDNGYNGVSWTGGVEQVNRYPDELRKAVDRITWTPAHGETGEKFVQAFKEGQVIFKGTIDSDGKFRDYNAAGKHVDEVIGKSMGRRILEENGGDIEGKDFTVGGEGMKGFYDKIIPDYLNKFGKKYNAKVGETEIPAGEKSAYKYEGPDRTLENVKTLRKLTSENGPDKFVTPFMEGRSMFAVNRVTPDRAARDVETAMTNRMSFKDAMAHHGSPELAQYLGGEMRDDTIEDRKTVQYLPITPEMRKSVTEEGVPLFNKEKPYKELDRLDPKATMGTPNSAAIITGDGKVKVGDGHYELMEENGYKDYADLFAAGGVRIRPAYGGMNIEIGKIDNDVLSRVRKTIASFPGMEFTVEFTPANNRAPKSISGGADLVLLGLEKWQRVGEAAAKYASPSYWHERGNDELFNRVYKSPDADQEEIDDVQGQLDATKDIIHRNPLPTNPDLSTPEKRAAWNEDKEDWNRDYGYNEDHIKALERRLGYLKNKSIGEVRQLPDKTKVVYLTRKGLDDLHEAFGSSYSPNFSINGASLDKLSLSNVFKNLDGYKSPHSREIKKLITQGLDDKGSVTIAMVPEKGQSLSEALATLREELGHTWQKRFEVEAGKHLPEIEFKKLNDAIPAAMSDYLKRNDYKDDDGSDKENKFRVLESAAKMVADNPKALGLSEDEWANYLFQYFELVEKTHGKDALDQLKHITTPARHVKEDYYNAKGNGSGSETDRGVLGGVQGGGEGSPKGTSSEKESDGGASSTDRRVNGGLQAEVDPHDANILRNREQTKKPEFKNWFGDWEDPNAFSSKREEGKPPVSMAVNKDGTPKVLYHSTSGDFNQFEVGRGSFNSNVLGSYETNRHGIFLAESPEFANEFVIDPESPNSKPKTGGKTIPVYLNIKSPLDLRSGKSTLDEDTLDDFKAHGVNPRWITNGTQHTWELFDDEDGKEFVRAAKEMGYDGAIITDDSQGDAKNTDTWVAFEPAQIKSAIGNKGTFDPKNSNILFNREQTKTPEFKKFFGESKVVDKDGEPMVLYHGTDKEFDEFTGGELGSHFGTAEQASKRLDSSVGKPRLGENIIPAYIRINNPIRLSADPGYFGRLSLLGQLVKDKVISEPESKELLSRMDESDKNSAHTGSANERAQRFKLIREYLKSKGYDGITYPNEYEGEGESYIAFDPTQIKSAIGNSGSFDPHDPNILRNREKITKSEKFKDWFGDWEDKNAYSSNRDENKPPVSMAVNRDGTPRVMYHATRSDFDTFEAGRKTKNATTFGSYDTTRAGIFFSPDSEFAEEYAKDSKNGKPSVGANVIPTYLNIKFPLRLDGEGVNQLDDDARQEFEKEGINPRWFNSVQHSWELFDDEDGKQFVDAAKKIGYDGAIIQEEGADGEAHEVWVAFDPNQIKSAVGNSGAFSKDDPNILRNRERFNPAAPDKNTPSDDGYLYHATSHYRASDIANQGLLLHKPGEFTDQDVWPDGSTKKRNYFTPQASSAHLFLPEDGRGALLRVKRDDRFKDEQYTGDVYSHSVIPPNDLEILGEDGKWTPISQAYPKDDDTAFNREIPSAAGQESSLEVNPVGGVGESQSTVDQGSTGTTTTTVIPIKGGTQLAAAPIQIPVVPVIKVHTSLPRQTTAQVSVPLQTAMGVTPVVTKRILPLSELKVLAAGLNPQRKVSNIKDLIAEANRRNPTKMIP